MELQVESSTTTTTSPSKPLPKKQQPRVLYAVLLVAIVAGFVLFTRNKKTVMPNYQTGNSQAPVLEQSYFDTDKLMKVSSEAELVEMLQRGEQGSTGFMMRDTIQAGRAIAPQMMNKDVSESSAVSAERVSSTNVQTFGVDEPDIVKTDGGSIYYSKAGQYRCAQPGIEIFPMMKMSPQRCTSTNEIAVVGALPPTELKQKSSIAENGEMLISGKTLIVFSSNENGGRSVVGYSIANANTPKKLWELPFSQRAQQIGARMYKNMLYLVTSVSPTLPRPCPIPLLEGGRKLSIACGDIYMPNSRPSSNTIYSFLKIKPETGAVEKSISLVGNSNYSSLYMSKENVYLSYMVEGDLLKIMYQFISENKGVLPGFLEEKIKKLNTYDLSPNTKEMELQNAFSLYINSMNEDEKLKIENNLQNTFKKFFTKYSRSFEYTGIAKLDAETLTFQGAGKVPGRTLNQFSFDEWKGSLRVATTVGEQNRFSFSGIGPDRTETFSDVYVLDKDMKVTGSVKDLGKTERIYSVRFIADRGYVVTFRQTDPFYVLDLSDGNNPLLKGELKIPGYSSYLHPLDEHLVLGIGRDQQVKLSLFDVKDPKNPKEISKYELAGEYWSEAMDDHKAFLQDAKYSIFFMPGSRGGYVFSYDGGELSLVKALELPQVKRGIYLNDYLYIVSENGITTLKEGTWDKVGEFTYAGKPIDIIPPVVEEPIVLPDASGGQETQSAPAQGR